MKQMWQAQVDGECVYFNYLLPDKSQFVCAKKAKKRRG